MESSQRQTLVAYLASDIDLWLAFVRHYTDLSQFVDDLNRGLKFRERVAVETHTADTVAIDLIYNVLERATKQLNRLPTFNEYNVYSSECIGWLAEQLSERLSDESKIRTLQQIAMRECASGLELFKQWTENQVLLDRSTGKKMIAEYFEARYVSIFRIRMDAVPSKTVDFAIELNKQVELLRSSCITQFDVAFPGGEFPERAPDAFQPVGISFLDVLLCGGLVKGEVYGHAAPIGGGKTTLVSQVCWSRAVEVLEWFRVNKYKEANILDVEDDILGRADLPQIYFCVYEPVETLLSNLASNAASIPRSTCLEVALNPRLKVKFSDSIKRDYKDYEKRDNERFLAELYRRELAGEVGLQFPAGEVERFNRATKIINRMIQLVDFSGKVESNRANAIRGVDGLRDYIHEHQLLLGEPGVNFVAIDFVGAAVDVMTEGAISKRGNAQSDRANIIRTFPQRALNQIALRFDTPVWLAHQLSSNENKRRGGFLPDPQSTEGSAMFLMYCAGGFASGKLSEDNVAAFVPGKQRKSALSSIPPQLARLDKEFGRWVVADQFAISGKDIVSKSDVHSGSRRAHTGIRPAAGSR